VPRRQKDSPQSQASQLLARLRIHAAPTPVEKIAKALGAQVRFSPFDNEISGMIYIKEGVPIIGVNSFHHPNRQRFTIAHEVAHLELHRSLITTNVHVDKEFSVSMGDPKVLMRDSRSGTGSEQIEIEANQFAAELLMPMGLIISALEGKRFDIDDEAPIEELAKKFRVSKQALDYRMRNLA
jgi:Zn-dependent peptidase ImmA (M78 family)